MRFSSIPVGAGISPIMTRWARSTSRIRSASSRILGRSFTMASRSGMRIPCGTSACAIACLLQGARVVQPRAHGFAGLCGLTGPGV